MNITMQDCRRAKMCRSGVKKFLEEHELDWHEFRKNGLPEEDLLKTNDALALKLVEDVRNGKV